MPFIPPEIRLQLSLVVNCPSEEDLQAAATRHGMAWDPITQSLRPLAPSTPTKRAARTKQAAAASQVSAGDVAEPIPADG